MSLAYVTQRTGTGGVKELAFKLDDFLVNTLGWSREYYTGGAWPASYTSLAYNDVVGYRNPTSADTRFEIAYVIANTGITAKGSIRSVAPGDISDGDTYSIAGTTYEFDTVPDGVGGGNTVVDISAASNARGVFDEMSAALSGATGSDGTVFGSTSYELNLTSSGTGSAQNTPISADIAAMKPVGFRNGCDQRLAISFSPLVDSSQGIAVGAGASFGTNPSVLAGYLGVNTTFRYSFRGDANHFFAWVESDDMDRAAYVGRVESPREDSDVDEFPVVGWGGVLESRGTESVAYPWYKISAQDLSSYLTGALTTLRHPTDARWDIIHGEFAQNTLSSATWQFMTPLLTMLSDITGVKREFPGSPIGLFLTANDYTKSVFGVEGEWAKVNGCVIAWEPGVTIQSSYP